ncbi:MAG: M81 family metallopeptidase, partial [Planctomycetaceae bacterium]
MEVGQGPVQCAVGDHVKGQHAPVENRDVTRILLAECKQEVSSFNPVPSRYADFRIVTGPDLLRHHRGVREELGG